MSSAQHNSGFEEVFTVTDYYDGPRRGIANFNGDPHFFDCIFREKYLNTFSLSPISRELFLLELTDLAIWQGWERAFHAGEVEHDPRAALCVERERRLRSLFDEELKIDEGRCIVREGAFTPAKIRESSGILVHWVVRWSEPSSQSECIWFH